MQMIETSLLTLDKKTSKLKGLTFYTKIQTPTTSTLHYYIIFKIARKTHKQ